MSTRHKTQKIIILFFLLVLLFSVLYPPYFIERKSTRVTIVTGTGWDWIFNLKAQAGGSGTYSWINYKKIRFEILLCEILAIVILAGIFIVLAKKTKRGSE